MTISEVSCKWITRYGKAITISSMTDAHIIYAYKKCIRDNWRLRYIPLFLEELESRGYRESHPELFI